MTRLQSDHRIDGSVLPMGRHELARSPKPSRCDGLKRQGSRRPGLERRLVTGIAAVLAPIAALCTAGAHSYPAHDLGSAIEIVTADVNHRISATGQYAARNAEQAASRAARRALPVGVATEAGLQVRTIWVARAVSAMFPEIRDIGGVRPDSLRWHPNGLAVDIMIPDCHSQAGTDLGNRIVAFALANADKFALNHVIWRQVYYPRAGTPQIMTNLGSDNANHYNHVHIATEGGGFPTGNETYFG